MDTSRKKLIVTYFTADEAIATERICNKAGIGGRVITTPRKITADCGMSFSIEYKYKNELQKLLESEKIKFDKIIELDI